MAVAILSNDQPNLSGCWIIVISVRLESSVFLDFCLPFSSSYNLKMNSSLDGICYHGKSMNQVQIISIFDKIALTKEDNDKCINILVYKYTIVAHKDLGFTQETAEPLKQFFRIRRMFNPLRIRKETTSKRGAKSKILEYIPKKKSFFNLCQPFVDELINDFENELVLIVTWGNKSIICIVHQ